MIAAMLFSAKAAATMKKQFDCDFYQFPPSQKAIFRTTCKNVRANGGNEIDAVCVFMGAIADSILDSQEYATMIETWMNKVRNLAPELTAGYAEELDQTYVKVMEKVS